MPTVVRNGALAADTTVVDVAPDRVPDRAPDVEPDRALAAVDPPEDV